VPFAARAKKALKQALREASARKDRGIGMEHLVLGVLRSRDKISLAVFSRLGIEPGVVRELVLDDLRTAA
jgi:ATP-dependent Clp protease ATP-binding subunit ClpA